jgi:hypothetical protein
VAGSNAAGSLVVFAAVRQPLRGAAAPQGLAEDQ